MLSSGSRLAIRTSLAQTGGIDAATKLVDAKDFRWPFTVLYNIHYVAH
jgi:hypothetical protein